MSPREFYPSYHLVVELIRFRIEADLQPLFDQALRGEAVAVLDLPVGLSEEALATVPRLPILAVSQDTSRCLRSSTEAATVYLARLHVSRDLGPHLTHVSLMIACSKESSANRGISAGAVDPSTWPSER